MAYRKAQDGKVQPKKTVRTKVIASSRRLGVESSETRAQLIQAAAELVRNEGCGAVTSRRLAEKVGLKRQIVHYYFRTIEDLLVAVIRRDGENLRARLMESMESDEPLRVIWEGSRSATKSAVLEFTALATHRKAVQIEVKRYMEEIRRIQTQALVRHLESRGIEPTIPPVAMLIGIVSIAQTLAVEGMLDVSAGHTETVAVVDEWLRALARQGSVPASASAPKRRRRQAG
jgi:TetR/AcrR family transcriptional regulator